MRKEIFYINWCDRIYNFCEPYFRSFIFFLLLGVVLALNPFLNIVDGVLYTIKYLTSVFTRKCKIVEEIEKKLENIPL